MTTRREMTLTCLGTGDAFGSGGRHCAGYLVETADSRLLLDAGPSILSALKTAGRETSPIDAVVLSHLHGDHFCGVPFMLLEYTYESPRTRPLLIVGPPGTERRVLDLYCTLYADAGRRPPPFEVRFVELADGGVHEVQGARIEAFRVPHMVSDLALGVRVVAGGRSLAYSGDTAWTPDLLEQSRGVDLFLCECSTFAAVVPGHIRYPEIASNRQSFDCGQLMLTHLGREMRVRSAEIEEPLANDGLILDVGRGNP